MICFYSSRHFHSWMNYGIGRGRSGCLGPYYYRLNRSMYFGKWNTVSDLSLLPIFWPSSVITKEFFLASGTVNKLDRKKSFNLPVSTLSNPHDRSFSISFIEFFSNCICIFLTVSLLLSLKVASARGYPKFLTNSPKEFSIRRGIRIVFFSLPVVSLIMFL